MVVLVLSASMSTLSSLVLTSSSTMTLDLLKDNVLKKHEREKADRDHAAPDRILPGGFCRDRTGSADVYRAAHGNFLGRSGGAFLAPFLYGLYWKGANPGRCVGRVYRPGSGITVSNMFVGYIESSINAGAAAMAAGLVCGAAGQLSHAEDG